MESTIQEMILRLEVALLVVCFVVPFMHNLSPMPTHLILQLLCPISLETFTSVPQCSNVVSFEMFDTPVTR